MDESYQMNTSWMIHATMLRLPKIGFRRTKKRFILLSYVIATIPFSTFLYSDASWVRQMEVHKKMKRNEKMKNN